MTYLPILLLHTKLTCQSSNLPISYSSLPYSSFVPAVVAVVVGAVDLRVFKGAGALELALGLKAEIARLPKKTTGHSITVTGATL